MPRRMLALMSCLALIATPWVAQAPKSDKDKDKDGPPKVATQGATPAVGEITLDYEFKNFISGDGRKSLKDFRGSVVLLDWWGIH
jgi:hypothetical protein